MREDYAFYLALIAIVLFGAAILLPNNTLTGNAVREGTDCGSLGCSQICDSHDECGGLVCCPTAWKGTNGKGVGLCEYPENCGIIADISMDMDLEEYVMLEQEEPMALQNIGWGTFWLPLLITAAIAIGIINSARREKL